MNLQKKSYKFKIKNSQCTYNKLNGLIYDNQRLWGLVTGLWLRFSIQKRK